MDKVLQNNLIESRSRLRRGRSNTTKASQGNQRKKMKLLKSNLNGFKCFPNSRKWKRRSVWKTYVSLSSETAELEISCIHLSLITLRTHSHLLVRFNSMLWPFIIELGCIRLFSSVRRPTLIHGIFHSGAKSSASLHILTDSNAPQSNDWSFHVSNLSDERRPSIRDHISGSLHIDYYSWSDADPGHCWNINLCWHSGAKKLDDHILGGQFYRPLSFWGIPLFAWSRPRLGDRQLDSSSQHVIRGFNRKLWNHPIVGIVHSRNVSCESATSGRNVRYIRHHIHIVFHGEILSHMLHQHWHAWLHVHLLGLLVFRCLFRDFRNEGIKWHQFGFNCGSAEKEGFHRTDLVLE